MASALENIQREIEECEGEIADEQANIETAEEDIESIGQHPEWDNPGDRNVDVIRRRYAEIEGYRGRIRSLQGRLAELRSIESDPESLKAYQAKKRQSD